MDFSKRHRERKISALKDLQSGKITIHEFASMFTKRVVIKIISVEGVPEPVSSEKDIDLSPFNPKIDFSKLITSNTIILNLS